MRRRHCAIYRKLLFQILNWRSLRAPARKKTLRLAACCRIAPSPPRRSWPTTSTRLFSSTTPSRGWSSAGRCSRASAPSGTFGTSPTSKRMFASLSSPTMPPPAPSLSSRRGLPTHPSPRFDYNLILKQWFTVWARLSSIEIVVFTWSLCFLGFKC